jgi:L-iditol 2-dehydrogenase
MIASGAVQVAPLISRTLALGDAKAAIASPARPGEVRALVIPD